MSPSKGSGVAEEAPSGEEAGVSVVGAPTSTRRPVGRSARERARRPRHAIVEKSDEPVGSEIEQTEVRATRAARVRVTLSRRTLVGLVSLCLVAVAAALAFGLSWSTLDSKESARQAVQQTAGTFLLDLTNFKPATVDSDFADLQNAAAPGSLFDKQASQTFNSNIRGALIQAQASSVGQLRSLYVGDVTGSRAQVYAVVDQAYQNSKMKSVAHDTLRLSLDLVNTPHGWRISAVTVENPSGTPTTPAG
jgi:hypothetical protein